MYGINHDLLLKDYLQKIQKRKMSQKTAATKLKIGRSTVYKLNNKCTFFMRTFLKLCEFTEEEPEKYIVKIKGTNECNWKEQKKI